MIHVTHPIARGLLWPVLLVWVVLCLPAAAQDLRLDNAGGNAGFSFIDEGEWGLVRSVVVNERATEAEVVLLIAFRDSPALQFGNRVTVPPNSRREVQTLISPYDLPVNQNQSGAEFTVSLVEAGRSERALGSAISIASMREPDVRSAIARGLDDEGPNEMNKALRLAAELPPTTFTASPLRANPTPALWAGLDTLVIATSEEWSPAQARTIRQWVYDGGRLWVMLDQAGPQTPRSLLGGDWPVWVVDEVAHTELELTGAGVMQSVAKDYPIAMTRVITEKPARVLLEANGYPAAFTWSVGRGQVLVTTVASGAWLDEKNEANAALSSLKDFFDLDDALRQPTMARADATLGAVTPRVQGLVGHRVLGRGTVVVMLAVFLAALLGVGLWLMGRGTLEWAAPAGVALSLIVAGVLISFGWVTLARTPGVTVISEVRRAASGVPTTSDSGLIALYRQPGAARLSTLRYAGPPPVLTPRLAAAGPRLLRIDDDAWSIENLNLAPGEVHTVLFSGAVEAQDVSGVEGRLSGEGLVMRYAGGGTKPPLEDALLIARDGRAAVESAEDGWRVDLSEPMTGAQFVRAGVLSQRQMQRSAVYERLLEHTEAIDQLVLLGWSNVTTVEVDPIEGTETRRDAIAAFPVSLLPPKPGEEVLVPSMLMTMSPYRDRELGVGGTIYDPATRNWVENVSNAQTLAMTYRLPPVLADLDVITAELTLDLRIPGRTYDIITVRAGKLVTLTSGTDPGGLTTITLTGPAAPGRMPDGSVLVGLRIGEGSTATPPRPWTLSRMDLTLMGRVPAP